MTTVMMLVMVFVMVFVMMMLVGMVRIVMLRGRRALRRTLIRRTLRHDT